jgi:hypothetical protein
MIRVLENPPPRLCQSKCTGAAGPVQGRAGACFVAENLLVRFATSRPHRR